MDKDEFLELIFKSISDSLVDARDSIKVVKVHCSGVNIEIIDNKNKSWQYNITIKTFKSKKEFNT